MPDSTSAAQLLAPDRLEELASALAAAPVAPASSLGISVRLHRALAEARGDLGRAYRVIEQAVEGQRAITPAARWILDNIHVIEEECAVLARAVKPRALRELPLLRPTANAAPVPRILTLARTYLQHSDYSVDLERLLRFVTAYQQRTPLQMSELQALPVMLRFALVTTLATVARRSAAALQARVLADRAADAALSAAERGRAPPDFELTERTMRDPYLVQLTERLRFAGARALPALQGLKHTLAREQRSLDELVAAEHRRQGLSNLAARHILGAFCAVQDADWRELFENASLVEAELRELASYRQLASVTRARYRREIGALARRTRRARRAEWQIARNLAQLCAEQSPGTPESDPGLLPDWPRSCPPEFTPRTQSDAARACAGPAERRAVGGYLAALLGLTALALWIAARLCGVPLAGIAHWQIALLLISAVLPCSELAVQMINRVQSVWIAPQPQPCLSLASGIPDDARTLVVVPVLIANIGDVQFALRQLELHWLATRDTNVRLALLSDWTDAASATRPQDAALLQALQTGIAQLNMRYPRCESGDALFFALQRRRLWNPGEERWMGWERKRGKLVELNALLRRGEQGSFEPGSAALGSDPSSLAALGIRYVLTLDADTRLPFGTVARLVGIALHPLNRPQLDAGSGRVIAGYGIFQPRIVPLLPRLGERTLYRDVVSGVSGMDPYAGAVSDLYQDLFGAGIYTGKGLYDLRAFDDALAGRVADNTMLSHDLFEGIFARCALVTDVVCYEDFPSHSEVGAARLHRWTRGDWQLLPWLVTRRRHSIPALGRWQLFDNLRRSLLAPSAVLLLTLTWLQNGLHAWVWIGLLAASVILPGLVIEITQIAVGLANGTLTVALRRALGSLRTDVRNAFINLALLAQNAWVFADAIARALYRQTYSHRLRLQWLTAAQARSLAGVGLRDFVWSMKGATGVVLLAGSAVLLLHPAGLSQAGPVLLLWWLAPVLARYWSTVPPYRAADTGPLRQMARRHFHYFTTFVGEADHFLPPDNYQETPVPVLAQRTSPTNIGLYLLSCATAQELGWRGIHDTADRIACTLDTLESLEQHHGHFYNWYDTRSLHPLEPRYVSTVDSGNLCGHLIALARWCEEHLNSPLCAYGLRGLNDTLAVLREHCEAMVVADASATPALTQLRESLTSCRALVGDGAPASVSDCWQRLLCLRQVAENIEEQVRQLAAGPGSDGTGVGYWAQLFGDDVRSLWRDVASWWPASIAQLKNPERAIAEQIAEQLQLFASLEQLAPRAALWRRLFAQRIAALPVCASRSATLIAVDSEMIQIAVAAQRRATQMRGLVARCDRLVDATDFMFLYNPRRQLFAIGWRAAERKLDDAHYDLLASEARLASYVAIAKGDVPAKHWRHLGRRLTGSRARPLLASWSGSMFEYLMASLVMREPAAGLLDLSARRAVDQHREYGRRHGIPWGISEAAYNLRDSAFTYQYSAFGVPALALRRSRARDLVTAPYASALAAVYRPDAVVKNFAALRSIGALGEFGFYDAIDFSADRLPQGDDHEIIRTYMAHHQGMSVVALGNAACAMESAGTNNGLRRHFHADPRMQAAELLLEERAPDSYDLPSPIRRPTQEAHVVDDFNDAARTVPSGPTEWPITHLLSNRRYSVMLTQAGSGYSLCEGHAVSRWREDATREEYGHWLYIRDLQRGSVSSATYLPTCQAADNERCEFTEDRAIFERRDGDLISKLDVLISAHSNAELRRLTLVNGGDAPRALEITSYVELVLGPLAADVAHRAFANLFVSTERPTQLPAALLAHRRARSSDDPALWAAHVLAAPDSVLTTLQYETDRAHFLGRHGSLLSPRALDAGVRLSNTAGTVLDPIFSLRVRVDLAPGERCELLFTTLIEGTRAAALSRSQQFGNTAAFELEAAQAWTYARAELHHQGIEISEARLFQQLAAALLYSNPALRADRDRIALNRSSVAELWKFGISGDRPLLVVRCTSSEDFDAAQQIIRAQEYWRTKQLHVDIVLLNESPHSYQWDVQRMLTAAVRTATAWQERITQSAQRPQVFALNAPQLADSDLTLLLSAARVILVPSQGSLGEQMARALSPRPAAYPALAPPNIAGLSRAKSAALPNPSDLELFNGLGGFSAGGREYQINQRPARSTPLPWVNVIANEHFGTIVSESGAMCTWSENSRENQLTPWSNDPIADTSGEVIYVRDEDSGQFWTVTAQPCSLPGAQYRSVHGQGYTRFSCSEHGLECELTVWVDAEAPLKWCCVKFRNLGARPRRLSITAYVEWQLGSDRARQAPFIVTERDPTGGAVLAHNPWNRDFAKRVAWLELQGAEQWSGSRREFIGRHGTLSRPQGLLRRSALSGQLGAGLDPCAISRTFLSLAAYDSAQRTLTLGQAESRSAALQQLALVRSRNAEESLTSVCLAWESRLTALQIRTPDRALDVMVNRWLIYQVISCRLWARAAFYQAGGAFGFRDQLQDVLALLHSAPHLARAHIVLAAGRQFPEGDVQHWWHPPQGRGVRTRFVDDRVWLAYVTARYVEHAGDHSILEEPCAFLEGPALADDAQDLYLDGRVSAVRAPLYDHVVLALDSSLKLGPHGLPRIGGGDWNDGMNRVGVHGVGESVWMAWFLIDTLRRFAPIAAARGDEQRALGWQQLAESLRLACEANAWDGAWYRRGYYDDGSTLGSGADAECRIDSIAQSWATISGAAPVERAQRALSSLRGPVARARAAERAVCPPVCRFSGRSGLHQELSARHSGKWWSLFTCRRVGVNRLRAAGASSRGE